MAAETRATITVDDKVVTFEGPRDFVDSQVEKYIGKTTSSSSEPHIISPSESSESKGQRVLGERELVLAKKPQGHSETVAVLAFALAQAGTAEFSEEDMKKAYLRAGVKPPKVVGQAIRDARNGFDYIDVGQKRGSYKLSHHGDRTVRFDLPRKETRG